jgi:hypothetical protein
MLIVLVIASPPWRTVATEMPKEPSTMSAHGPPSVFPSLWENGRRRSGGAGDGGVTPGSLRGSCVDGKTGLDPAVSLSFPLPLPFLGGQGNVGCSRVKKTPITQTLENAVGWLVMMVGYIKAHISSYTKRSAVVLPRCVASEPCLKEVKLQSAPSSFSHRPRTEQTANVDTNIISTPSYQHHRSDSITSKTP